MDPELYHAHHSQFEEDLPFWISQTAGLDPVLDLGCGTGRVSLPLARAGHRVWGVDWDPAMLDQARKLLVEEPRTVRQRVTLVEADLGSWLPDRRFGAAVSACNTWSALPDQSRRVLLENLAAVLGAGAVLAFSVPNPVRLSELAEEEGPVEEDTFLHPESGFPVVVSSRITREGERIGWVWIYDILHPDGRVTRKTVKTLHSRAAREGYRRELTAAGWELTAEYGDFDGSVWQEDSPYLIITAAAAP